MVVFTVKKVYSIMSLKIIHPARGKWFLELELMALKTVFGEVFFGHFRAPYSVGFNGYHVLVLSCFLGVRLCTMGL